MKRWLAIAAVIVLAGALVFFNQGVKRSATPDHDEDEKPSAAQTQNTPAAPGSPVSGGDTALLPEETVGSPASAKFHIEAGWVYDEKNQKSPETLTTAIRAIHEFVKHSPGPVSAEIVNLDVPPGDRSAAARAVTTLGLRVNGRPVSAANLSDIPGAPDAIYAVLSGAVNKK